MGRTLLLITGAGRSGTSTAAGALHHLGVHVPGPHLAANETNPRGFYEAKWSVAFHNRLLKRGLVGLADGRPEALDIVREVTRDADRRRLLDWVEQATSDHDLSLVKDPRAVWAHDLWSEVTSDLGISLGCLVMLRHPAEVLGSRATHYATASAQDDDPGFAPRTLAGWVNTMLLTEQQTRGRRRSFLRYDDLLGDWRGAMATVSRDLGVHLDLPAPDEHHPVDDFVDPGLSRHRLTWDDVDVPADLEDLARTVWSACERLAGEGGSDVRAEEELDAAGARYVRMYDAARHLTHDHTVAQVKQTAREAGRSGEARTRRRPGKASPVPPAPVKSPARRAAARRALSRLRAMGRG